MSSTENIRNEFNPEQRAEPAFQTHNLRMFGPKEIEKHYYPNGEERDTAFEVEVVFSNSADMRSLYDYRKSLSTWLNELETDENTSALTCERWLKPAGQEKPSLIIEFASEQLAQIFCSEDGQRQLSLAGSGIPRKEEPTAAEEDPNIPLVEPHEDILEHPAAAQG